MAEKIKSHLNLTIKLLVPVLALISINTSTYAQVQDSLNSIKLGHLEYANWNLSDIWGYVDSAGNEYALVGVNDGLDIVDVTNPANPQSKLRVNGAYSVWRDIKSWSHYAYVCHDFQFGWSTLPNEGITIVDLDSLQPGRVKRYQPKFTESNGSIDSLQTAHNLYIDENGVLYVFGSNIGNGGVLMFDVATDPWNPTFLGSFETFYQHDGYARNDTLYGSAVNNGVLCVVDVTNKAAPQLLATAITPNQFTHNCWLSDDGNTVYTTDEVPGAYITAYDVSNLSNISELDRIRALPGTNVIPHNIHVYGDYLVTSYYTRGLHIVDAAYPDLMVEVGWYDTSPTSGSGFSGAWGAYPYLPSGNVLVSDMQQGLFVVDVEYTPASRLYGKLVDSITGNPVFGAEVDLFVRGGKRISRFDGSFKYGVADQGWDALEIKAGGYYPKTVNFQFNQGNYDTLRIAMLPLNFGVEDQELEQFDIYPNPCSNHFKINWQAANAAVSVRISNMQGQLVFEHDYAAQNQLRVDHNLNAGLYLVEVSGNGKTEVAKLLVE